MPADLDTSLDTMLRDAWVMSGRLFTFMYGPNVHRQIAADNSVRLYCSFAEPKITPYVRSRVEHKTPPRKNDKVIIYDGDNELYGHIVWVSKENDGIGIFVYNERRTHTYNYSDLESHFVRNIRWRIYQ